MLGNRAEQARGAIYSGRWIASCEESAGLEAIGRSGVQLAIWRRALPARLTQWLSRLKRAELPELSMALSVSAGPSLLASFMTSTPDGPMRALLAEDVCSLVRCYAALTGRSFVTVRLECVSDDSCARFHRDASRLRLFTTYRGKGTEFVGPAEGLAAIREQRSYDGVIERMGEHEVAVWKGTGTGEADALVHRSPPMQRSDIARLVLCIDAPVDVRGWTF
jgi:hypothetical protein